MSELQAVQHNMLDLRALAGIRNYLTDLRIVADDLRFGDADDLPDLRGVRQAQGRARGGMDRRRRPVSAP